MKKNLIFYALLGALVYGLVHLGAWKLSDKFSISQIQGTFPFPQKCNQEVDPAQIQKILNQPFYYEGKGSQAFVFKSKDNKYVIKFFRFSRYHYPDILRKLPFPSFLNAIREGKIHQKLQKQKRVFESCCIALDNLREETELVYLHLHPSSNLKQKIKLYNKMGAAFLLESDDVSFIIQKKGELFFPYLSSLLEKKDYRKLECAFESLNELLKRRFKLGIEDLDPVLKTNIGFYENKAFFLDVGSFVKNDQAMLSSYYKNQLKKITFPFHDWLRQKDPLFATHLERLVSK